MSAVPSSWSALPLLCGVLAAWCGSREACAGEPPAPPDPVAVLRFLDGARAPGQSVEVEMSLTRVEHARRTTRRYRVLDDGAHSSVVEFLDPLERGQKVLATATDLWFLSPRVHRAVRIPPAQRVFGEASYGDIARVRWSQDYHAELDSPAEETIGGERCWRLLLTARGTAATYRQIRLAVTQRQWLPRRADFLVASGKVLKTVEFPDAHVLDGVLRNDRWILRGTDSSARHTILSIETVTPRRFEPNQFSRRHLELKP